MWRDMFTIFYKTNETLDRLLFDRDMRRSWQAMWILIGVQSVWFLLIFGAGGAMLTSQPDLLMELTEGRLTEWPLLPVPIWGLALGLWVVVTLFLTVYYVLSRFLFAWFVRAGLRIVARGKYPATPEERREKGELVGLIHPYTLSMTVWPDLVFNTLSVLLTLLGAAVLVDQIVAIELIDGIVSLIGSLLSIAASIYMIVTRVWAIEKIYGVSGAQAFWGPFLIYVLAWIPIFVALVIALISLAMQFSDWY